MSDHTPLTDESRPDFCPWPAGPHRQECHYLHGPSPDIQRSHTPLTDEELAAMKARAGGYAGGICMAAQKYWSDVPRLIADLRASRARADELAMALHQCSDYLPLFIEDGPKLRRAQVIHERVQAALKAYCAGAGITRQELHRRASEAVRSDG